MLADLIQKWVDNVNVPIGHFQSNSAADLLEHILEKEVRLKVRMQNPKMCGWSHNHTFARAHTYKRWHSIYRWDVW